MGNERKQKITFSEKLVTKVWERPYTNLDEKSYLFYNAIDYSRFRTEYKKYKKELKDQERINNNIKSAVIIRSSTTTTTTTTSSSSNSSSSSSCYNDDEQQEQNNII